MPRITPPNPVERRMSRFLREPPSVRTAASVIVTATAMVVVVGGVLMRFLDHDEYSNVWVGMWWALQTVTTVGYGDVVPKTDAGRVVGGAEMVLGVSFIAFVTAGVTSTVIQRAQARAAEDERAQTEREQQTIVDTLAQIRGAVSDLDRRLEAIEASLRK
jgi:voltage-gated potassium channel